MISISKEQGKRLIRLRNLANLSRKEIADKYCISVNTYTNWELGVYDQLSKNAVKKITYICQQEGIKFSIEWLLYGVGEGPLLQPKFSQPTKDTPEKPHLNDEEKEIINELLYFRKQHSQHIDTVIADDGMEPRFTKGEYVAGIKYYRKAIENLIGEDCIIQTDDGKLLVRRIKNKNQNSEYTLTCINSNTTVAEPVLYHVKVVSAAPVLWQRRKLPR